MFRKQVLFSVFAAAAILAACSGGGGALTPSARTPVRNGSAAFTITVPPQVNAGTRRAPKYISPNSQSISIAVSGEALNTVANLTPGSPDCSSGTSTSTKRTPAGGSAGLTCTIDVTAPIGTDTFTLKIYSGTNGTGQVLATASVTKSITDKTPITVTMNGVSASVTIALGNASPLVGQSAAIPVTVTALDPSGAVILSPGTYDTPIALTDSDASGHTSLSTNSVAGPGASVTLNYDGSAAVTSAVISAQSTSEITSVTPAVLRPANAQNGGGGVGVVTLDGEVYAEVPSASGLIQVPLTSNGALVTTPPSPAPSAAPTSIPNPNARLLPIAGGIDACALAPVSGSLNMFCVNVDQQSTPIDQIALSGGAPVLSNSFATDAANQLQYSGGNCYVCGITWDARDGAILIGTGSAGAICYQGSPCPGSYEFYNVAGAQSRASIAAGDMSENFGYNSATDQISDFGYTQANLIDVPSGTVYTSTDTVLSGANLDSSAVDPATNLSVAVDEYNGDETFTPLGSAVLVSPQPSAGPNGTFTDANADTLGLTADVVNGTSGACLPDAIAVDGTSHTAFLSGEWSTPSCVSAIQLPSSALSAPFAATQYMSIMSMPFTPDGSEFDSALDPHVAATFYLSGSDVYGLVYDYCRAWVAVVDVTKLLAAPASSQDPHIVDPSYDVVANKIVTYIPTGYNPGPASNGYGSGFSCAPGHRGAGIRRRRERTR